MDAIEIRRLKHGDESEYRRTHLRSLEVYPDHFGTLFEEQSAKPRLQFEDFVQNSDPDNFVFGAFCDTELAAIAGFRRGDRQKTRHRGEIVQVFVDPKFQGRNIGESLLRAVIQAAFSIPGIESLELSLVADNEKAERLYKKVGFETYGIRHGYFKQGEQSWDQRFMEMSKETYFAKMSSN